MEAKAIHESSDYRSRLWKPTTGQLFGIIISIIIIIITIIVIMTIIIRKSMKDICQTEGGSKTYYDQTLLLLLFLK